MENSVNLDIFLDNNNIPYEEDIIRNPCHVKSWLRYIQHQNDEFISTNLLYERALKEIPGSYKLWNSYLKSLRTQALKHKISHPFYKKVNNIHERALMFMNKMPRIWTEFCIFLKDQGLITYTRRTLDRSLQSLPITQHHRIWPVYIEFVELHDIPETGKRAYRRYLKFYPNDSEDYIDYLKGINAIDEAACVLIKIVNEDSFVSKEGKSNYQLWYDLCDLVCKHPSQIKSIKIDPIIRSGIKRFSNEKGKLWNSLADYYIRAGHFEKARDIYEEAILDIMTVRDFTQVFDAYSQFEESSINKIMELSSDSDLTEAEDNELELRLARLENLMERRLLLLNSVLLRQNPHNVHEWLKRVKLYDGDDQQIILTFEDAIKTVNEPKLTVGRLSDLWIAYADFYEKQAGTPPSNHAELANETAEADSDNITHTKFLNLARQIYSRAVKDSRYAKVDHLAQVWCSSVEMEIRWENYDKALDILQKASTPYMGSTIATNYFDETETVQARVHKCLKIWALYADLEESFGTFNSTKAVYDRIIELRIATPQIIMNYGLFLEENRYFEEAFKAYEKGIALFKWPNVYDIWNTYLSKFVERYGGTKLERARDLFEQCLEHCPPKFAKSIYLLYAKLEEDYGLSRHAMSVYDRATLHVLPTQKYEMFQIYIERAARIFGLPKTRTIYQKAIEVLPNNQAREMCLQFSELECKLGEIDRGRAIYAHGSQMADPRTNPEYWQIWKEFEVKHGNEDTVREMLRIRRSVQAIYNTHVNFISAQLVSARESAAQKTMSVDALEGSMEQEEQEEELID
ncbi:unnamed protein product [Gordionus sp. m RMFG-2023]|uniref:pre-mRNA-splicing factor SYF1-like n=1 Tax=Gordionus sp. m RMFG-2023 TaxID=3053472 RepID=UPI0030E1A62B